MPTKIHILQGEITNQAVDALMCEANTDLTMDEGLAAAILRQGGLPVREDCERQEHVALGGTTVTTAGSLRAFYVVHAVVRRPRESATVENLRLAVHHALLRVEEKAFKSVAIPALGTEAGLSAEISGEAVIEEVLNHLKSRSSMEDLYFVLPDEVTKRAYEGVYQRLTGRAP